MRSISLSLSWFPVANSTLRATSALLNLCTFPCEAAGAAQEENNVRNRFKTKSRPV